MNYCSTFNKCFGNPSRKGSHSNITSPSCLLPSLCLMIHLLYSSLVSTVLPEFNLPGFFQIWLLGQVPKNQIFSRQMIKKKPQREHKTVQNSEWENERILSLFLAFTANHKKSILHFAAVIIIFPVLIPSNLRGP